MGMEFQFGKKTNVLEMDGGGDDTIIQMCLMPLNCTFKNGKLFVVWILGGKKSRILLCPTKA